VKKPGSIASLSPSFFPLSKIFLSIYPTAILYFERSLTMEQAFRMNSSCELHQLQSLYSEINLPSFFRRISGLSALEVPTPAPLRAFIKLYMCKVIFRRIKADLCNKGSFKNPTYSECMYSNPVLKYYSCEKIAHKDY